MKVASPTVLTEAETLETLLLLSPNMFAAIITKHVCCYYHQTCLLTRREGDK
jgi:hypothetical protein